MKPLSPGLRFHPKGSYFLRTHCVRGVLQRGKDVFALELRIVPQDLFHSKPGGKLLQKNLDGDSGSADNRLAEHDLGIDHDPAVARFALYHAKKRGLPWLKPALTIAFSWPATRINQPVGRLKESSQTGLHSHRAIPIGEGHDPGHY